MPNRSGKELHALLLHGRERTVPSVARLIGAHECLDDVLQMTSELFHAQADVAVDDVSDTALLVTVRVGQNADVELSRKREQEWYRHLVEICPSAEGRIFLFVSYE